MIGTKIADRYEILGELGRGGMGVVYRAHDPLLGREVAVKLLPHAALTADAEERLQREARVVAQMDHPAIVVIHDIGRHEGALYFLMPVVGGIPLRSLLRQGSLRLDDVLHVGIQVAEALEYSHSRGIVHRDIKPENVMVSRQEGEDLRVRVLDFGLARSTTQQRLTGTGALVGTLAYLSPEQVSSSAVDGRSDVYSLGTVLYECVVGEPPFSGEVQALLYRIVHENPQPPRSLGVEIDEELEDIILRCLSKHPARRPQRAAEMAEALRRYRSRLDEASRAQSISSSRTIQILRPPPSPFIGREEAFGELQRRLNAALAGECQLALVGGEPGIGKTRLLEELERLAAARRIRVLHGRFVEQDQAFVYQGFCEVIQDHFRSCERQSSGGAPADFSDLASDLVSLFPVLTEIAEIRSAATSASKLGEAGGARKVENRTYIFELLARSLTRIAGGRPLLVLFENLHAADVSIEALQYIVWRLGPTPTLIVGTYRSTDVERRHPLARMLDAFHDDPRFASIVVGPFSATEHRALLESVLGGPQLTPDLVARLYDAAEGNPFFTRELVRSLLDSGGIARDDSGVWRLGGMGISSEALPQTIQQAVEKRIERLPADLRDVLSVASVLGKSFEFRDLKALAGAKGDMEDALDRLAREGLIEEERESRGDRFAFSSGVVRDVIYGGLSRRKRRSLHGSYAELLERRHAGRLERVYPQLFHHVSQADVPDKTVEYGLKLARKSLDACSPEDALRTLRTVLEHLEDEDWAGDRSLEGEARALLALALRMRGDLAGALREAGAAVRVFDQERQGGRSAAASLLAAETAWQGRWIEEARGWLEKGIATARAAEESETLARLLSLGATVANLRGDYARAREYLDEAERVVPAAGEKGKAEEVPRGGRLVVALANPVLATEPAAMAIIEEEEVLLNVFETLLATDAEGNLVPWLCDRWEARDGGRSFSLTLRANVRFHDGRPLTAREVKACFERTIRVREAPVAAHAAIEGVVEYLAREADHVSGLVALSDEDLEIRLVEPLPIFPALLTDPNTGIARAADDEGGGTPPVGTGPFRLASHHPERVVLERNPGYWRGVSPPLDAIEFRASLSASAIAAGLRSGELDLARDFLPEDLDEILRDPRFRSGLVEAPKLNVYFVLFNCRSPLGGDANLRRALAGVIRTHDVVWRTLGRFAQPATGLLPPGILGHDPGRKREGMDREAAVERLRTTGLTPPIPLKAAVHPLLQDRYGSLTKVLCETWSLLGVEVSAVTPTMESFIRARDFNDGIDLMIGRWNADYADPDNFSYGLFHSRLGLFRAYFSSPETDRLAEEARVEARAAVRASLYRSFENALLESGTLIPLFHEIDYRVANPRVRRLRLRSSPPYVDYSEIARVEAAVPPATVQRAGGIIRVPIAGFLGSLDPSLASTLEQTEVLPNVFETLTRDVGGARIVPWLASEFRVEEGGRRFRFRLREDVRFHDGRRLTARDVRYSYERLLCNGHSESRGVLSSIRGAAALIEGRATDLEGFRILSSAEFTIDLTEPVAFFPVLVSYIATAIVPEGSDPSAGDPRATCVGTGPFRVVRFDAGAALELERNPSYWRAGYPRSDGLVFHLGISPETILSEFRAGRLSLASDLFPADVEALRQESDFASGYRETPRLTTYMAGFNVHRGPLSDLGVRRRLAQAAAIDALVPQVLGRLAIPAHGVIPPGLLGYDPAHKRAGARTPAMGSGTQEGLREAVELTAAVHPVFLREYAALAREVWSAFREKGLRIRPVTKTITEYLDAMRTGAVDIVLGRWNADYPDADTFVYGLLHTREGAWGRVCGCPEIDGLAERGRAEADPAVRHALYRRVEEIIVRDVLLIPLFHEQVYRFARPEVEAFTISFSYPAVAYENLSIRR